MSIGGLFSVGTSALQAAYTQLQTTGNNIANVNTPGYSRQEVVLATAGSNFTGSGFIGRGVDAVSVQRSYDRFLSGAVTNATSTAAGDQARADQLTNLDNIFADTTNGIGAAVDNLSSGLADLVNQPSDASARTVVVGRAGTVAQRINSAATSLSQLGQSVNQQITQDVASLNTSLNQLASINDKIAQAAGSGQTPNDLLDQRDALVDQINQTLKTTQYNNSDGTVNLFSSSGQALILGKQIAQVSLQTDPTDSSKLALRLTTAAGTTAENISTVPYSMLGGGSLQGLMQFRNDDLASANARLEELSISLASAYNSQQALGTDPSGAPGAPLFTPPVTAAGANKGNATFTVTSADVTQFKATDYRIDYDGSAYTLTRKTDPGNPIPITSWPQTVDGLTFNLSGGTAQAGDSFNVSAQSSASTFSAAISSGTRLATGYAVTPSVPTTNSGDVKVSAFSVTSSDPNLSVPVTITFDGAGKYSAVSSDGKINSSGLAYTPGMTISYNGWSTQLTGTPGAGDTVVMAPTANPSTDNRNARALLQLGASTSSVNGRSFTDAFAEMLADIGARSQGATASVTSSQQALTDARASKSSVSGVNLDEEAAKLLQYQQAYQAAAKLLTTAQTIFQSMLDAMN